MSDNIRVLPRGPRVVNEEIVASLEQFLVLAKSGQLRRFVAGATAIDSDGVDYVMVRFHQTDPTDLSTLGLIGLAAYTKHVIEQDFYQSPSVPDPKPEEP